MNAIPSNRTGLKSIEEAYAVVTESNSDDNGNGSGLVSKNGGRTPGKMIEIREIADYIAEMLDPLSKLAGETGMEFLSVLISFAAKEAHQIKDQGRPQHPLAGE